MAPLKLVATFLALAGSSSAAAQSVERWRPLIEEAAARFGVPAAWIERVMRAESGGHTTLRGRPIVSRAGAMGLMQLMPGTWAEMRARLGLGSDPHSPRDNILAGTLYLRLMYDRFGYPGLFGAYNAGPARYAEHVRTGRKLPDETRGYLASVAGATAIGRPFVMDDGGPARAMNPIFFVHRATRDAGPGEASSRPTLFVVGTSSQTIAPSGP